MLKRDDLIIKGMEYLPEVILEEKYAAIIVSHGFTGVFKDMERYGSAFSREGYAVYTFSFCGGSRNNADKELKSDGDSRDMTISTEMADLLSVIKFVRELEYIDEENVILLGESQGGFVSGLVAAKCRSQIKKLIMIYPALCIPDHARRGCLGGACYDVKHVPDEIDCGNIVIGKKMHEDVCNMDPFIELSPYKGNVLIIHGTDDKIVDYSYSVRAKENYEQGQCHLQIVRNMAHGIDEEKFESIIASIRQFLNDREEIMTFRIIITHQEKKKEGKQTQLDIYFTGYCDSKYFTGTILPDGVDRQIYINDVRTSMRADYTFKGVDEVGEVCMLHVVNQWSETDWKPVIKTDSEKLSWINEADLTAVLEGDNMGLTVRIYRKKQARVTVCDNY